MTFDFTAIDFETANSQRASVCSVGMVRVRDGQVVHQSGGLVHPPAGLDHFDGFNTSIHGITAAMAAKAPQWPRVASWIARYVGTDLVVCHNAGFDIGVLRDACSTGQIPWPRLDFLCTMVLARRALRLPSYRLPYVAAECGIDLTDHHQALSDARAAAQVAVALARRQGVTTLRGLADALDIGIGHLDEGRYVPSTRRDARSGSSGKARLVAPEANPDADPEHPFYGRVVVFTGALQTRTRQDAWNDVARVGGIPEQSVTRHTNVLVAGDINPRALAPGTATTGKAARAFALQADGQDIEVMTEDDFLRSLQP